MIKVLISPERIADTSSVNEMLGVMVGNVVYQMRMLPKMIQKDGEYVVGCVIDEDGDPILSDVDKASAMLDNINPKRFDKLRTELTEAVKLIVNPPKGGGLNKP